MDNPQKGRILRIRMGHEANCSSGMISGFFLMCGSGVYLLLSLITSTVYAVVRTNMVKRDEQDSKMPIAYWTVPQLPGLGLAILLGWIAFADNAAYLTIGALAMSVFLALSTGVGYILMQRVRRPVLLIGTALLVPLIYAVCLVIFVRVVVGTWVWDIY